MIRKPDHASGLDAEMRARLIDGSPRPPPSAACRSPSPQVTLATGPAGTTVTVTGTGFSEATAVSFGGTPATFTPIGNYLVTVTTPYGTSVSPTPVYVAYEGPHLD
jgi:hypothetical protein